MDTRKGLFVVLDPSRPLDHRAAAQFAAALQDFRALGYRLFGITIGETHATRAQAPGVLFDDLIHVSVQRVSDWEFPTYAWSAARRFSLNVRRSLLCSPDPKHEAWARNAGLRRFETLDNLAYLSAA